MARLEEIDYVVGDGYREKGIFPELARRTGLSYRRYNKPGFITEYGGSWHGTTEARLRADLHSGIWSAFLTEMAGTPLFWWFDYVERKDLYFHYRAFSSFIKGEDKRGRNLKETSIVISGPKARRLGSMSAVDEKGGYVWIFSRDFMLEYPEEPLKTEPFSGISLKASLPKEGEYIVEVWDTLKGAVIQRFILDTKERWLNVDLPDFVIDCAMKIRTRNRME